MARVAWKWSVAVVVVLAFLNFAIPLLLPCNDGFFVSSCFSGLVFLFFLTIFIFVIFLLICGVERFLIRVIDPAEIREKFNRLVFFTAIIFSAVYLVMLFLTFRDALAKLI